MTPASSADVCYRHPTRESWTLCTRCGRTICPECQILTPSGVQCPDCVQELGGSVRWESAGAEPRKPKPAARASRTRVRTERTRPQGRFAQMLMPGGAAPLVTWVVVGAIAVLYLGGFFAASLPFRLLAADPSLAWQVWRFVTASVAYPSDVAVVLSVLLGALFFLLIGPSVERTLGRPRYVVLVLAAAAVGSSGMLLTGLPAFGISGVMFGVFGAYLVLMWHYPPARIQGLVIIAINLLFTIVTGGFWLPQLVGGLIAGAGATSLYQRYEERGAAAFRTPTLIVAAASAGFVLLAILRSLIR